MSFRTFSARERRLANKQRRDQWHLVAAGPARGERQAEPLSVPSPRRGAEQEPGDSTGRQRAAERRQYFFEPGVTAVVAVVLKGGGDGWIRQRIGDRVRCCRILIAARARLSRSDLRLGVEDAGKCRRIAGGPYARRRCVDGGLRRP